MSDKDQYQRAIDEIRKLGGQDLVSHAPQPVPEGRVTARPAPAQPSYQPWPHTADAVAPPPETVAAPAAVAASRGQPDPVPPVPKTVTLSKPYMAFGEMVQQVTFREPLGADIARHGNPLKLVGNGKGQVILEDFKYDVIIAYIATLSDPPLPPSTVAKFVYADVSRCTAAIADFFMF